jgi:hypothetical protein
MIILTYINLLWIILDWFKTALRIDEPAWFSTMARPTPALAMTIRPGKQAVIGARGGSRGLATIRDRD